MITEKITSGQKKQLMRVLEDGVDALNLAKDQADRILKVGNQVQADLKTSLSKNSTTNKFGSAIREFEITVPVDYNHTTQVDISRKKALEEDTTRYYHDELTSEYCSKASNKLVPGRTYKVKIFPVCSNKVFYNDIMDFLEKQKAILVNGQGLTLVYDLAKDQLPKDKIIASLDEEEYLLKDCPTPRVPCILTKSNGNIFKFYILKLDHSAGVVNDYFGEDTCLLCFSDK